MRRYTSREEEYSLSALVEYNQKQLEEDLEKIRNSITLLEGIRNNELFTKKQSLDFSIGELRKFIDPRVDLSLLMLQYENLLDENSTEKILLKNKDIETLLSNWPRVDSIGNKYRPLFINNYEQMP